MSLDDALFLVQRSGTLHHSKGSDIGDRMVNGDSVLVQRNGQRLRATYDGSEWSTIQDSDLLLAWDGTNNRRVTGANFKTLFIPPVPPIAEWDWKGHKPSSEKYYEMCYNERHGHAVYTYDWKSVAFSFTDRKGQTNVWELFIDAKDNGDKFWFKVNNEPAFQYTSPTSFNIVPYNCAFTLTDYAGIFSNATGIIRWYNTNPDAP